MLVVDKQDIERIAVGAMLASASGDLDGTAHLLASLSREELIGSLTYCARFAVSYARATSHDDDFLVALRWFATRIATAPAPTTDRPTA